MPTSAIYTKGEKSPLYVSEMAQTGTLTFTAAPTFTLYDATGAIVTGFNAIPVSGFTAGAQTMLQAYFDFDTNAANIGTGYYYALIMMPFVAQDSITRVRSYDFDVYIREVAPTPAAEYHGVQLLTDPSGVTGSL